MDLSRFMPNWKNKDTDEAPEGPVTALERLAAQRNHGPRPVRTMTNGQIRRAIERDGRTRHRKQTQRFRRSWMDHRLAVAVLRGQLATIDEGRSPVIPAIERVLVETFGSVDAAREKYAAILGEAN